jgi:chitin synthase
MSSAPASASAASPTSVTNLTSLVHSTATSTTHPTPDVLLTTLQSRSRLDLPYTWIGDSTLLVVNPLRGLGSASDESAKAYAERTKATDGGDDERGQPHLYELAGRVWRMMKRCGEDTVVVYRCVMASNPSNTQPRVVELTPKT